MNSHSISNKEQGNVINNIETLFKHNCSCCNYSMGTMGTMDLEDYKTKYYKKL